MSTFHVSLMAEEFSFVFLVENKQLVLLPVGFVSIFSQRSSCLLIKIYSQVYSTSGLAAD